MTEIHLTETETHWKELSKQDKLELLFTKMLDWSIEDIDYQLEEEMYKEETKGYEHPLFPKLDEMFAFIKDILNPESPNVVVALGDSTSSTEEE